MTDGLLWLVCQANQQVAARVLAAAEAAGVRDVEGFAAKALRWAADHGGVSDTSIVRAAQHAASSDQASRVLAALRANTLAPFDLSLQATCSSEIHRLRRLLANFSGGFDTSAAAAAEITPPRTAAQARVAYNLPKHWITRASGLLAPDQSALAGEAAQAWDRLTAKFGVALAERLFDASVRGGIMPVIAVLDAARSIEPLTVRDVSELQGIARSDGKAGTLELTLHDLGHATTGYGPAAFEEVGGDQFAEFLLTDLFGDKSDLERIPEAYRDALQLKIDFSRPLADQPTVVRDLPLLVDKFRRRTSAEGMRWEVQKFFYAELPAEIFIAKLQQDWTGRNAKENARELERLLERGGMLASLGPAARERIKALIYGEADSSSFEGIAKNHDPTSQPDIFKREFVNWVRLKLTEALVQEVAPAIVGAEAFRSRAADAIAEGLMLERAAPGQLLNSPIGRTLIEAENTPALRNLDLRKAYPPARAEVRRALGMGS